MTIANRERPKLNDRFYDPNPPGVLADYLVKLLVEVNMPKAEAAIRAAAEEAAAVKPKESIIAGLHKPQPEREAKPTKTRSKTKSAEPEL